MVHRNTLEGIHTSTAQFELGIYGLSKEHNKFDNKVAEVVKHIPFCLFGRLRITFLPISFLILLSIK